MAYIDFEDKNKTRRLIRIDTKLCEIMIGMTLTEYKTKYNSFSDKKLQKKFKLEKCGNFRKLEDYCENGCSEIKFDFNSNSSAENDKAEDTAPEGPHENNPAKLNSYPLVFISCDELSLH